MYKSLNARMSTRLEWEDTVGFHLTSYTMKNMCQKYFL